MTLYGPLTAESFLDRLKRVARGGIDRAFLETLLDAVIGAVEAERGFLLDIGEGEGLRVLAARNHDGVTLPRRRDAISLHALRKALAAPERCHLASAADRDRRYRTERVLRGGKPPCSILAVVVPRDPGAPAPGGRLLAVYLDHRFQEIAVNAHRMLSIEHWLVLIELAFRVRHEERLRRRRERRLERLARRRAFAAAAVEAEPAEPVVERAPRCFHGLWSRAPALLDIFAIAERLAGSDIAVLIRGETGTGKGHLARAVHAASRRSERPFVAVDCGALPEALLESELFGHTRGAFTGAETDREGLLAQAEGGTLFLDEIADMTIGVQKKLLRFLENGRYRPLGARAELQSDVRLIAATRSDLQEERRAGRFRADLFYRLCGIQIDLPPLRARREDIALLAERFLERHAADFAVAVPELLDDARRWLAVQPWPGNGRELENAMRQALALGHSRIDRAALVSIHGSGRPAAPAGDLSIESVVAEAEARAIREALSRGAGNKSWAARELGITRKALYRRLVKYGMAAEPDGREGGAAEAPSDVEDADSGRIEEVSRP